MLECLVSETELIINISTLLSSFIFILKKILKLLNPVSRSHEWLRQDFSLQYQYNIKQINDENKENINWRTISWSNTKFS